MVPLAVVLQYAAGEHIAPEVADQEIVLHYALALLNQAGLVGRVSAGSPAGPLLFKGGTALRKCVFGSTGRFSRDIDLDATRENGFEAIIEEAIAANNPFYDISFSIAGFRYSQDGNFSGTTEYRHDHGEGRFELQISYRMTPILDPRDLELQDEAYFSRVEFDPPLLHGLDAYEMIGEKIMACNRRRGGSAKDVYDLHLWSQRPFSEDLVRRVAVLKAWTDQRRHPTYQPDEFLASITVKNFRWEDIGGLVPRRLEANREAICREVRSRFGFLAECTADEASLLNDQTSHRLERGFNEIRSEARRWAEEAPR